MAYNPRIFGGGGFGRTGGSTGGGGGAFNINPGPQGGQGAFGAVPGSIGMPVNRLTQTGGIISNLPASGTQIGQNILSALQGDIDWGEIQDEAARFGVQSGMPGSPFSGVRGLRQGEAAQNLRRRQGLQDYLAAIQGVGSQLDDPALAAQIATQNAVWRSAPDPQSAADEQMRRWQEQFDKISGTGGRSYSGVWGPGEGTVSAGISGANFGLGGGFQPAGFGTPAGENFTSYPVGQAYGMPEGATSGFAGSTYGGRTIPGGPVLESGGTWEDIADPFADFFEGYNYLDNPEEIPALG